MPRPDREAAALLPAEPTLTAVAPVVPLAPAAPAAPASPHAVEPTPEMAAACRARGVDVIEKRVEEIGDELGAVDIIVSFEVIEHLFAPRLFLDQCARLLRQGGLLVLSSLVLVLGNRRRATSA